MKTVKIIRLSYDHPDVASKAGKSYVFEMVNIFKQGIPSDTIPSHCTILLTGLIAGWILIS